MFLWGLTRIINEKYLEQRSCWTNAATFSFKYQSLFDADYLMYGRWLIFWILWGENQRF